MRAILATLICLALPASAQQAADGVAPEGAGVGTVQVPPALAASAEAKAAGRPAVAEDWMIAAAHPLAVEAGAAVLRDGGTAADAMVAAQAVLGLSSRRARASAAARSSSGMTGERRDHHARRARDRPARRHAAALSG